LDQATKEKLEKFLHRKEVLKELRRLTAAGQKSLVVEFEQLLEFDMGVAKALLDGPNDFLDAADAILTETTKLPGMRLRVKGLDKTTVIRDIRAEQVGKFIQVEGIMTRASEVKPEVKEAVFKCLRCGEPNRVMQIDEVFREPLVCENPNCSRRGPFKLEVESSEFRDWQSIRVQERPEELRGGRMPRQLDCIIKDDFVDKAVPGNHIVASGVLRVFQEGVPKQRKTTFRKILFINHIEVMQKGVEETELSPEDEARIKELGKDPWLRNLVIQSIAPSIYGYEAVKEGIALQLFGCSPVDLPDGTRIRGDTHTLLTGDPGCLVADERIVLGNGAIVKIGELGSEHLQPLKKQVLTGQGYRRDMATRFHVYRDQPILEIVTETGKSIRGTFNHPLLVMEKQRSQRFPCPPVRVWRRMDEIRPGDRVVTVPWISCSITAPVETGWRLLDRKFGPRPRCRLPARLDKEVAAFLGYMLGDGWVRRYRMGFHINHEEKDLLPLLSSILERKFGLSLKVRRVKRRRAYLGEREIRRRHPLVEAEVHSVDVAANLYFLREKRVPTLVMRSGNEVVAEFLAWLFGADGCVFSKGRGRRGIQLKATNIELLRDVQILLLRFGIHSRIVGNNLTIRRARSIFKFSKAIGFRSRKKCTKLAKLVVDCRNLNPWKCRGKQLSERVVIVRPAGRADVYDIEVPGSHRFIANGVISHNTAKSEILKWVSQVAPRGLYTSGKKATGAGLCVAPNSLIWVCNGLIPIADLVENHFGGRPVSEITAMGVEAIPQFSDGANAITSLWKIPAPQKMVEILTQYGKKIEVTLETRVMTEKGWKKAKELTTDDRVILPMNYGGWSSPYPSIVHFYPKTLKIKNRAEIFKKLSPKVKEKRALAKALGISEDKLYYEWLHDDVRGAMTLEELRKLCSHFKVDVSEILDGLELKGQLRYGIYFKLPTKLSPKLAYFVGLIAGDGSLSERKRENSMVVRFSNNDLKGEYVRLVRDLFGKEVEVSPPSKERAQDFRFGNRAVFELLRGLGIQKPKELFIPREILCSRELAAAYLRGLFDTDGSVYDRRNHGDGKRGGIEITTIYRKFAEQIQNILFRLGIPAYLTERRPRTAVMRDGHLIESKKQYRILITQNAAIDRFAKVIGFSVRRKGEKLKEIIGRKKFHQYTEYAPAKIKEIRIVPSRHQYVYDMTVEGSHSFIANGFLVHNTAAAVRDEIGGGWTLEAGALVITDGGLCCIDEFDKMSDEDRGAILESLEQQTISVAKAGIVATLNTRTSVLAAANPKGGRFDKQRLISEQIDLPPVILSRFDLIFIMRDEPLAERDRTIAHHMLELHREPTRVVKPPLDVDMLRKLIVHARKNIDPKFEDEEVLKTIENFYVKWRSVAESGEAPVPITPRQLEALIRLAKANARMRLSDHVTVEDANRAIKIVSFYLREAGVDTETGKIDIDVLMTGRSRSQREKLQRVLDIIRDLETEYGGAAPVEQIKRMAETDGISASFVEKMIEEELRRGHLYEPKQGMVSRTVK